jgi:thiamine-monophosphate kinase
MSIKEREDQPTLSDLGEREIVRRLIAEFPSSSFIPPGDDCGAIEIDERLILLTTDTKSDETHFPQGFTGYDKGWSIAAANLSDIAAMGGIPVGFLIAYGLPRDTQFSVLRGIQAGIEACLTEYSTQLVGADTKENLSLTLTGTAVGIIEKREVLLRKNSRPGDVLCVSGPLGAATLGLRSLKEGLDIKAAEEKLKKPLPRIAEGRILAKSGMVTSCMDISDGLSSSLYEMMRASANGFEINSSSVPVHETLSDVEMSEEERLAVALNSGDEYELLFTVRPDSVNELHRLFKNEAGREFIEIGYVTGRREVVLRKGSAKEQIEDFGFEHFC